MPSLVRARWLVTSRADGMPSVIENGGLAIEDGLILEVDTFDRLRTLFPDATIEGTGADLVMPFQFLKQSPMQLQSQPVCSAPWEWSPLSCDMADA